MSALDFIINLDSVMIEQKIEISLNISHTVKCLSEDEIWLWGIIHIFD